MVLRGRKSIRRSSIRIEERKLLTFVNVEFINVFSETIFWSFCSLICKELAIIYSFLIGSNNSWSFVLCKKFDNPAHFNQRNQRNSRRGFLFTFSTRFDKIFLPENYFNLFRRFLAFIALKSSFSRFLFRFWTLFAHPTNVFFDFESKNWRFLSFEINCEILIILSSILSFLILTHVF